MNLYNTTLDWLGERISGQIICAADPEKTPLHTNIEQMSRVLRPGDVILVDGCDKISAAIRYLTQSSWSHAAMYVDEIEKTENQSNKEGHSNTADAERHSLIEVNVDEGCVSAPLSKYEHYPTRICRPVNLTEIDRRQVVQFMIDNIGLQYDMRNIFDLARFLLPQPPIPRRFRRRMLSIGSGEPTRAICSSLIAQAFQSVRYPILPRIEKAANIKSGKNGYTAEEILHIRHHSLFAPRDFDISPFFDVIKPTIKIGFDYKKINWSENKIEDANNTATTKLKAS